MKIYRTKKFELFVGKQKLKRVQIPTRVIVWSILNDTRCITGFYNSALIRVTIMQCYSISKYLLKV